MSSEPNDITKEVEVCCCVVGFCGICSVMPIVIAGCPVVAAVVCIGSTCFLTCSNCNEGYEIKEQNSPERQRMD